MCQETRWILVSLLTVFNTLQSTWMVLFFLSVNFTFTIFLKLLKLYSSFVRCPPCTRASTHARPYSVLLLQLTGKLGNSLPCCVFPCLRTTRTLTKGISETLHKLYWFCAFRSSLAANNYSLSPYFYIILLNNTRFIQ